MCHIYLNRLNTYNLSGDNSMKKAILPLAIASLFSAAAFADVVVYGKGNVSFQNADEGDNSQLEVVSNASRIGIKGGEEISSSLKAIYQFEYQTEVDDGSGSSGTFAQRNIYVGLQGSAGTIMGGKFDTPTKVAQEKIDLFNDLEGDLGYLVAGETRASNIVQYVTPASWGAIAVNVATVAAETATGDDGVSVSFTYTTPELYLALATESNATAQDMDITRLVGRYTAGALQLGAMFEQSSFADMDADAWLVSAKINANDKLAFKAQYGDTGLDVKVGTGVNAVVVDGTKGQLSLGVDYYLSKNTTVYGYYTQETADNESVNAVEMDDNWLGMGLELKF
jgi:predicted porin